MAVEEGQAHLRRRRAHGRHHRPVECGEAGEGRRVVGGPSDPGRVLEDAAEMLDEGVAIEGVEAVEVDHAAQLPR
ncbi:hypothetical protein ABIC24_006660 [Methylobacterium radiotolerans]